MSDCLVSGVGNSHYTDTRLALPTRFVSSSRMYLAILNPQPNFVCRLGQQSAVEGQRVWSHASPWTNLRTPFAETTKKFFHAVPV